MSYTIVLGGGESGVWASILAKKNGERVLLSDSKTIKDKYKNLLQQYQVPFEEGGHLLRDLSQAIQVIKSPGIPDHAPVIQQCITLGIPVISEIEYAARYTQSSKLIGITGSNGKTTTTTLISHLLKEGGLDAISCGNIGTSLAQCVVRDPHDIYVIELSSFQLDHMYDFAADIAVLMNITPDHLDRYEYCLDKYADAKGRIFNNMPSSSLAIYSADDEETKNLIQRQGAPLCRIETFGITYHNTLSAYIKDEYMCFVTASGDEKVEWSALPLKGNHNLYNMMAACLVAQEMGVTWTSIRKGLSTFHAVEHRMEPVATINGVTYINDSKATNIDSCHYALETMPEGQTILLLGGTDKGNDYNCILPLVRKVAKVLIFLTTDSQKLHQTFDSLMLPTFDAQSMDEAFEQIQTLHLTSGDVVLLSPACASFDLFNNYEHRGDCFKQAVKRLQESDQR